MPRVNQQMEDEAVKDNARGKGRGTGGTRQGDGGTGTCVCPECGTTTKHERGTPCTNTKCPKCGAAMTGMATNEEDGVVRDVLRGLGDTLSALAERDPDPEGGEEPPMVLHLTTNELSHDQIRDGLRDALRKRYPASADASVPSISPWPIEVYDKELVYELGPKLFKIGYSIKPGEDGVTLAESPVEVKRVVTYEPVSLQPTANAQQQREARTMEERKKQVDALIANTESGWLEEHRNILEGMPEGPFKKVLEAAARKEQPKTNTEPPKKAETVEALLANASDGVKGEVEAALALSKAEKAKAIAAIKANERNKFTDEELNAKSTAELSKLAEMLVVPAPKSEGEGAQAPAANMGGKNTAPANNADKDAVPEMPRMSWDK